MVAGDGAKAAAKIWQGGCGRRGCGLPRAGGGSELGFTGPAAKWARVDTWRAAIGPGGGVDYVATPDWCRGRDRRTRPAAGFSSGGARGAWLGFGLRDFRGEHLFIGRGS